MYYNDIVRLQIFKNYENLKLCLDECEPESIVLIEDPEPVMMLSDPNSIIQLLNRFAYIILIFHTQYMNISKLTLGNWMYSNLLDVINKYIYVKYYDNNKIYGLYINKCLLTEKKLAYSKRHKFSRIHGVNDKYFIQHIQRNNLVYYIGKIDIVHKNLQLMKQCAINSNIQIFVFGDGVDKSFITYNNDIFVYKGLTNSVEDLNDYGIYVSFSYLEGLCTATAEAIVMNKRCLILNCECNTIFRKYKNVYFFNDDNDFVHMLAYVTKQNVIVDNNKNDFKWSLCNKVLMKTIRNFGML